MTRDEVIARNRHFTPALKAVGVSNLAIFGSRSRPVHRRDGE
jgi:hypothetical protein